jgi:hypothetical protein
MAGPTLVDIRKALLHAFPVEEIGSLVVAAESAKLEKSVREYLVGGTQYRDGVFSYLKWVKAQNRLVCFLKAAREENPDHPELGQVMNRLADLENRFAALHPVAEDGAPYSLENAEAEVVKAVAAYEAKVLEGVGFENVGPWLDKLGQMRRAICRIEPYPDSLPGCGTGYLVAPDIVMTNFHVAEPFWNNSTAAQKVVVRFDFEVPAGKVGAEEGDTYPLRAEWKPGEQPTAARPHPWQCLSSPADESAADKFDFALLRLARPAVDDAGKARPCLELTAQEFRKADPVLILQHPAGEPLKLSFGSITKVESTRVRYMVNTKDGSSGSPCLTQDLKVTAIHHFTTGNENQAVTHQAILNFLRHPAHRDLLHADGLGRYCDHEVPPPPPPPLPLPPKSHQREAPKVPSETQVQQLADAIIDEFNRGQLGSLLASEMRIRLADGDFRPAVFALILGTLAVERFTELLSTLEKARPHGALTKHMIPGLRASLGIEN